MLQTVLSLSIVAATAGWMLWRAIRPALARTAVAVGSCACGKPGWRLQERRRLSLGHGGRRR